MLHSLATAQVSRGDDDRLALPPGAVLRGPVRTDLIRDELLCEIFAATAARRPSAIAMITVEAILPMPRSMRKRRPSPAAFCKKGFVRAAPLASGWRAATKF